MKKGRYEMSVFKGNYSIELSSNLVHYSNTPINHSANFTSINQSDTGNHFILTPKGIVNDLEISLVGGRTRLFPNQSSQFVTLKNIGTTSLNSVITLWPDSRMNYNISTRPPSLISNDSLKWVFNSLGPLESNSFGVLYDSINATQSDTLLSKILGKSFVR